MRPAQPDDPAAALLYLSAKPYYDAYAGSESRARAILERLYPQRNHAASFEVCTVAETLENEIVGVMAAFPATEGDHLARRFVALSLLQVPPLRWPRTVRHLRASGRISPQPPRDSFYVDALAVTPAARRRGVAAALLDEAAIQARRHGAVSVALDTGLANDGARALYERTGFELTGERRAPDARTARAVGGPGFVSYVRRV